MPIINAAFAPSETDITHVRAVVAAFEANPDGGALKLDSRMIDAAPLKQAKAVLGQL